MGSFDDLILEISKNASPINWCLCYPFSSQSQHSILNLSDCMFLENNLALGMSIIFQLGFKLSMII